MTRDAILAMLKVWKKGRYGDGFRIDSWSENQIIVDAIDYRVHYTPEHSKIRIIHDVATKDLCEITAEIDDFCSRHRIPFLPGVADVA